MKREHIVLKNRVKTISKYLIIIVLVIPLFNLIRIKTNHVSDLGENNVKTSITIKDKEYDINNLSKLYDENNELYGWIKIEGTNIDYPVMFKKQSDYYINHNFYKEKNSAGSIFIDKYNIVEPRDTNLILYGHNMKDGTMFHDLINYKEYDYYISHKNISFNTLTSEDNYEIIAVFLSKVYNVDEDVFKFYKFYSAHNTESFNYYIDNVKALSLYDTGVTAEYGDELITLSTCEYSTDNGRFVVVAKKI